MAPNGILVAMMRVLGVVEIDGHGTIVSRAQRVLISALVLDAGRVVASDRLAELVWGASQPENPTGSLHNHISRLRKTLPEGTSISAIGPGYRIDSGAAEIDVAVFMESFQQAGLASVEGRLQTLEHALSQWRGEPYVDLDDSRAAAERSKLIEAQQAMREMRSESLLSVGRPHEAIASLETQRAEDPLRERTVELLMQAYLDSGRKVEALDAYQDIRRTLAEELGLDPSPS